MLTMALFLPNTRQVCVLCSLLCQRSIMTIVFPLKQLENVHYKMFLLQSFGSRRWKTMQIQQLLATSLKDVTRLELYPKKNNSEENTLPAIPSPVFCCCDQRGQILYSPTQVSLKPSIIWSTAYYEQSINICNQHKCLENSPGRKPMKT